MPIYPLLPLRGVLVYPDLVVPLEVGRPKSVRALESAMQAEPVHRLLFVSQRDVRQDSPGPEDLYTVGTVADIDQFQRTPSGAVKVVVEGRSRARVLRIVEADPYFLAEVEEIPEPPDRDLSEEVEAWVQALVHLYEEYMKAARKMPPETLVTISADDPARLCDAIATHLDLRTEEKQRVLEAFELEERLRVVHDILSHQHRILKLEREIQGRVRQEVDAGQREFFLRAQMKAIQEELGEDEDDEATVLRRRLESATLPEEVQARAERELRRLGEMSSANPESVVARTYLDWILSLPWPTEPEARVSDGTGERPTLDLREARRLLDREHFGLERVKERILEYLAVQALRGESHAPILCFVGPPGVGKTSLGHTIAEATSRRFVRASLGGVHDEAEIRGHRRTYVGAMPGRVLQGMRRAGSVNPVFLLDEIDKLGSDYRGDPSSALLEVLDPEQNHAFSDHYLELPYDLSRVLFITTANRTETISRPLLDRMEMIRLPGYTEEEKIAIARRHLFGRRLAEHGLGADDLKVSDGALSALIRRYTREAGVRQLDRGLAALCRKAARRKLEGRSLPLRVSEPSLGGLLGPGMPRPDVEHKDRVGVATACYVSDMGGDTMPVEVALTPGRGRVVLTGQLGDVMQESARAALTYARAHLESLGLPPDFASQFDVHVHVPDGATPKDGPSAGITICTALVSALTDRPVDGYVAMTGEITLRGQVMPIGGLKEKVLAAARGGYTTFLYPQGNQGDLEEIPRSVRRRIRLLPVREVSDVFDAALRSPVRREKPLREPRLNQGKTALPGGHPHVLEGPS